MGITFHLNHEVGRDVAFNDRLQAMTPFSWRGYLRPDGGGPGGRRRRGRDSGAAVLIASTRDVMGLEESGISDDRD